MLALRELQAAFAGHLGGADRADLLAVVAGGAIAAAARLEVHRHHVQASLGAALAATFPTIEALVGADFFRRMSRDFVRQHLPSQPVLAEYGEDFPSFIAGYEPAGRLPYLSEIAGLDWALNLAFQAPMGGRLTAADLAAIPVERLPAMTLRMAPGACVIRSAYPLDRIWRASQSEAGQATVELNSGPCHLLILRRLEDSTFVSLSVGEAAFVAGLLDGATLEAAAGAALQADPAFDLTGCFAHLLALGAFAALQ
jgi:hypothetical protein